MLESIQKRILRIIYPNVDYKTAMDKSDLPTLHDRRTELCKTFYGKIIHPDDKLYHIIQEYTRQQSNYKLRGEKNYKLPLCKTDRFKKTFIPYSLFNFQ